MHDLGSRAEGLPLPVEDLEDLLVGVILVGALAAFVGVPAGGAAALGGSVVGGLGVHDLLIKAGGDDSDADLVLQALVEGGAEDDEGVGIGGLLHQVGSGLHFLQAHVGGAGDVHQHAAGR